MTCHRAKGHLYRILFHLSRWLIFDRGVRIEHG